VPPEMLEIGAGQRRHPAGLKVIGHRGAAGCPTGPNGHPLLDRAGWGFLRSARYKLKALGRA
jgi:hypothetical protein